MLNALSNLYRTAWLDLVFKDRNKSYGAYVLRTESSKNLVRAFFIAAPLFTLSIALPQVVSRFNSVHDVPGKDRVVEVLDLMTFLQSRLCLSQKLPVRYPNRKK
jgi:protein TonB